MRTIRRMEWRPQIQARKILFNQESRQASLSTSPEKQGMQKYAQDLVDESQFGACVGMGEMVDQGGSKSSPTNLVLVGSNPASDALIFDVDFFKPASMLSIIYMKTISSDWEGILALGYEEK